MDVRVEDGPPRLIVNSTSCAYDLILYCMLCPNSDGTNDIRYTPHLQKPGTFVFRFNTWVLELGPWFCSSLAILVQLMGAHAGDISCENNMIHSDAPMQKSIFQCTPEILQCNWVMLPGCIESQYPRCCRFCLRSYTTP